MAGKLRLALNPEMGKDRPPHSAARSSFTTGCQRVILRLVQLAKSICGRSRWPRRQQHESASACARHGCSADSRRRHSAVSSGSHISAFQNTSAAGRSQRAGASAADGSSVLTFVRGTPAVARAEAAPTNPPCGRRRFGDRINLISPDKNQIGIDLGAIIHRGSGQRTSDLRSRL